MLGERLVRPWSWRSAGCAPGRPPKLALLAWDRSQGWPVHGGIHSHAKLLGLGRVTWCARGSWPRRDGPKSSPKLKAVWLRRMPRAACRASRSTLRFHILEAML